MEQLSMYTYAEKQHFQIKTTKALEARKSTLIEKLLQIMTEKNCDYSCYAPYDKIKL